jgi:hypothetical protein
MQKILHVWSINKPQCYITEKIGENVICSFFAVADVKIPLDMNYLTNKTFISKLCKKLSILMQKTQSKKSRDTVPSESAKMKAKISTIS